MAFMVAVAAYMAILSMAWRGNVVAFGLAASLASLIPLFLVYGVCYWILWCVAQFFRDRSRLGVPSDSQPPGPAQESTA